MSASRSFQPDASIYPAHSNDPNVCPNARTAQLVGDHLNDVCNVPPINDAHAKVRSPMVAIQISTVQRGPK
jgi:hypothetical protein